jgi:serine/threonine protein kinase/Flp pilus assembly protein TadD
MIKQTILHYKILEKLGEGGMGVVYKAEDTKLKRDVAIKFLPKQIAINEEERERFKIEAQAAAALNHPNIAHIYAIEDADDEMFIVMEYIEGKELKDIVEAHPKVPLPVDDVINYAAQIAEGLQVAHKKGIVHRDIKSSNIMITEEGKVKIMDFGLAKVGGHTNLTKAGTTLGTVGYMSPEQTRGEEVDQTTDIWSLGIVLYEMLTGERPFKGEYEAATIYEILNEEPKDIHTFRQDVPNAIATLLSEMLQKDPNKRIKSTTEILGRLKIKPVETKSKKEEKSIAVLYFENMSPDKENEYFCAGITEDIIIDLSKIHQLKVIPRSDVLPFRTKEVNSRKVGEILGVTYILEGSVRKAGQQIRVTTQLINVQSGFQIWAERYDRLLEDIFDVQIELSQKIAEALKVSLSESERELLAQKPTDDLRAHDFYMRGRDFLTTAGKKNNESAIKMFEHALSIDPNYSLAYLALAEAYAYQYMFYDGDQKWLGMIISVSEKAKELDANLLEVEITKAMVLYYQKRFADARRTLEKFIEQKDESYLAHHWLGLVETITNNYNNALEQFTRASELKPYSEEPWLHKEMTYRRMGDPKAARAAAEKVLEITNRKIEINAKDGIAMSRAAATYAIIGKTQEALTILKKVLEVSPNDGLALYNCACTYAQIGKKKESLEFLQKAIGKGYNNIIEWIENDPDFEPYRDDPQFREILAKASE